jgi:drug/metabolite transporter (DMT)-like permease
MNIVYLVAIGAALCFGNWPLLARLGGAQAGWFSFLATCGCMVVTSASLGMTREAMPTKRGIIFGLMGGLVNGLGMVCFGRVTASKETGVQVSVLLPMIFALMTVATVISSALFLNEPLTTNKLIGAALIAGGIWFLN